MDAAIKSQSAAIHSPFRSSVIALLGPDHVRPASLADAVAGVHPKLVVDPGTEKELAEVLRLSNEAGLAVIPRGGGTKLGWGNPPSRADLILSTARLDEIIEHAWADLTVTVQASCTIQRLQETLAQHGQRLALDPLWPEKTTVGGVLSTNDSGALRLRFGALRDLIIGVTIALPDGTLASSGGKVVKNVAGYDLPKLVTGALGTLGVITRAVFRLHPLRRYRGWPSRPGDAIAKSLWTTKSFKDTRIRMDRTPGPMGFSRPGERGNREGQHLTGELGAHDRAIRTHRQCLSAQLESARVCNGDRMAPAGGRG